MQISNKQLHKEVRKVLKGKKIINNLTKKYHVDKEMDFFVVLTDDDLITSVCVLLYLNLLVKQFEVKKNELEKVGKPVLHENEKFIILTNDNRLLNDAKVLFPRLTEIILLDENEIEAVIKRFSYMYINLRFIIGSMEINGRHCKGLINKGNVSLNEIVAKSILGIEKKYYKKWRLPMPDMKQIINREILDSVLILTDKGNERYEAETGAFIG